MKLLKRILRLVLIAVAVIVVSVVARGFYAFRDRSAGYVMNVDIPPSPDPRALRVGFGRVLINPDLSDKDKPVWLAGFSQNRRATAIHDDLEAIACVLDDGAHRVGLVALDAIGFFHDDVIRVRQLCRAESKLDYVMVCSTHNHSTPDLLGLWGPNYVTSGVSAQYRQKVIGASVKALEEAVAALSHAEMRSVEIKMPTEGIVADTRQPEVFDPNIRVMVFSTPGANRMIGSIIGWANHPETVWSRNTEITADYCGYLRRALESGVRDENGDREFLPAAGGIHLFLNGAIGGLISTTPRVTVRDPFTGNEYGEPSHDKARALGRQLAAAIGPALNPANVPFAETSGIGIRAKTFSIPLKNPLYFLASYLGVMDRGYTGWKRLRTETALITVGDVSFACIPGEVYPEIVNGGVQNPTGADFSVAPREVPPIRELMPGRLKFVVGLANDELGYIIPRSQWDEKPPYTFDRKSAPYGEINSCGPETATMIYEQLAGLCGAKTAWR